MEVQEAQRWSGPSGLTAWLGGPPNLRGQPDLIQAVLDELLALVQDYGVRSVWSSEPRTYRLSPKGRSSLAQALAAQRIERLVFDSEPGVARAGGATALISLATLQGRELAVRISLGIEPTAAGEDLPALATRLTAFVTQWFAPLQCAAAFVSDSQDDGLHHTAHERQERRGTLVTWNALRRYARGAFWGTGLGPDLCAHLGGRERVLHEAPVAVARPLGEGAWLQVAPGLPAGPDDLARLRAYLAPLLEWTAADRLAANGGSPATQPFRGSLPADLRPTLASATGRPVGRGPSKAVPMSLRGGLRIDTGLNVYLASPPTPAQVAALHEVIAAWYLEGFRGGFGGAGFHELGGPSADGAVVRWHIDFGSADARRALRALRERLAALPNLKVERLVVGTEQAG